MLPVKIKNITLSETSHLRLETYYRRYCTGEAGELYGIGHMLFACYAAFPLLISPDLANYLWLNFSHYTDRTGSKKINRVVVSDFLLSPLVRPVARRQYEVIPDIRNYLLYLLQDGEWFRIYGVDFGDVPPLMMLAQFLSGYTKDESSSRETNPESFRELNQWAALAYLAPGELTLRIGRQLAAALENQDESRQLRINVLMDRIGAQAGLSPVKANQKGKAAFNNLRSYSQGNRARLFQEPEKNISAWYYQLHDAYLSEQSSVHQVSLPITQDAGTRLNRRKGGRLRVFPVLLHIDRDQYDGRSNGEPVAQELEELLGTLSGRGRLFESERFRRLSLSALNEEVFSILAEMFTAANPEDLVLIYYFGQSAGYRKAELPYQQTPDDIHGSMSASDFQRRLAPMQAKGCKTVLIMDSPTLGYSRWLKEGIQIINQETSLRNKLSESGGAFSQVMLSLLRQTAGQLTYAELVRVIPYYNRMTFGRDNFRPILIADQRYKDQLWFSTQRLVPEPDQFLVIYERSKEMWRVIEEDFKLITRNTNTTVSTYDGHPVPDALGEVFIHDEQLSFGRGSKGMNNQRLYRIRPEKPSLRIILKFRYAADPEWLQNGLKNMKINGYSLWSSRAVLEDDQYSRFRMEVQGSYEDGSLSWHYLSKPDIKSDPGDRNFHWETPKTVKPETFLRKFSAYEYLMELQYPDWFPDRQHLPFGIEAWWNKDGQAIAGRKGDRLIIKEDSFTISDNELKLKPLTVEIRHKGELPLYCDLYIVGRDLSVSRMTRQNVVVLSETQRVEFRGIAALERLLDRGTEFYLKILYSNSPITVDFSQEGLRDGIY